MAWRDLARAAFVRVPVVGARYDFLRRRVLALEAELAGRARDETLEEPSAEEPIGAPLRARDSAYTEDLGLRDPAALRRYAARGFHEVDGWLAEGMVEMLLALTRTQIERGAWGHMAEIGVHHGRLLILLALLAREGERTVGFDLFENQAENTGHSGRGDRARAEANIAAHVGPNAPIELHTTNSKDIDLRRGPASFLRGATRLFSVDGGHDHEIVRNDLDIAFEALGSFGVVLIDDFWHPSFLDVNVASIEYLLTHRDSVRILALGHNKLLLCRAEDHAPLLDGLQAHLHHAQINARHSVLDAAYLHIDIQPWGKAPEILTALP